MLTLACTHAQRGVVGLCVCASSFSKTAAALKMKRGQHVGSSSTGENKSNKERLPWKMANGRVFEEEVCTQVFVCIYACTKCIE